MTEKIKFTTVYDSVDSVNKCGLDCSNTIKSTFKKVIDPETGRPYLVKTGERDIQEEINAYEKDCSLYCILDKAERGLISIPDAGAVSDSIVDMTVLGDDPHKIIQNAKAANEKIKTLPNEVKSRYGDNFDNFDFAGFMNGMVAAYVKQQENVKSTVATETGGEKDE